MLRMRTAVALLTVGLLGSGLTVADASFANPDVGAVGKATGVSSKVYVKGTGRGDYSLHYRPKTLQFGMRSVLVSLRWSTWNGPRARGTGRVAYNDCVPSCAQGGNSFYAVRVILNSRSTCGTRNRRYRRLALTYVGAAPAGLSRSYRERFPC